ncbi:MAG TPA: hypothetical protein VIY48_14570 [Candidatus Paceibacterota bacterium]
MGSSAAQAAVTAPIAPKTPTTTTTPTTINPAPIPLGISKDLPNAGIYMQQQSQAELAYQQAQAELLAQRNTQYHTFGLNEQGVVDPFNQFGKYQGLLSAQESALSGAYEQAQQRNLGGVGLAMQQERALRYQQGMDSLGLQQDIATVGQNYTTGIQQALAARNAAVLQAQLSAAQGGFMAGAGGSYGGAGGAGGGVYGGLLEVGAGSKDMFYKSLAQYGLSDETVGNAADAYAKQRGWNVRPGGYEIMHNGVLETVNGKRGYWIKFQDAQGRSTTEFVPIEDAIQAQEKQKAAQNEPKPPTIAEQTAALAAAAATNPVVYQPIVHTLGFTGME